MKTIFIPVVILSFAWCLASGAQSLPLVIPQNDVGLVVLIASNATIHGTQTYVRPYEDTGDICTWRNPREWISWEFDLAQPGEYVVEFRYACANGSEGSSFEAAVGVQKLTNTISQPTGSWYDQALLAVGTFQLNQTGRHMLSVKPLRKPGEAVMNLSRVRLAPAAQYQALRRAELQTSFNSLNRSVFIVPNFHPASCGWLTDFSTERNYCAYSYLEHLNRVRDDPSYAFALSEVNNMMAIAEFEPERFAELKRRVQEGRVELCNGFFLEPTINLSGGEALVKMGVEGLRWQQQVFGVRPRLYWGIDVTGVHEQMGQIVAGLGLDAFVYTRDNPTGSPVHWMESPDGSRVIALAPGHYSDFSLFFSSAAPLSDDQLAQLGRQLQAKARRTPAGIPILVLGGNGDYALPPACQDYPRKFRSQWGTLAPNTPIRFTGPSAYLDIVLPMVKAGALMLPTSRSGARLTWSSFWIQCPTVKRLYRQSEHQLQAAEAVSAIASLKSSFSYPVAPLHDAWLLMCLNMDRNTLWGAAGGMVFQHSTSWDAQDRFDTVQNLAGHNAANALRALLAEGPALGVFNPINWSRTAPVLLKLPPGTTLAKTVCQADADGQTLCRVDLPPVATAGLELSTQAPEEPRPIDLPETIETKYYTAKLAPAIAALVSLKLKPSGLEVLGGPVLIVAESGGDGHNTPQRAKRKRWTDSAQTRPQISVMRGPLATVIRTEAPFYGTGLLRQTVRFYPDHPRIDFEVETQGISNRTVVLAEFPLARDIKETRRGIPYGFSRGAWSVPNANLAGFADGILAAIRWSDYASVDGGGVALLDRGLPGRELTGRTPALFLQNAQDFYLGYRCDWLSGKLTQKGSFALLAHEADWEAARVPQAAWEFNAPPMLAPGVRSAAPMSFVQTSDNVIVEALRREGEFVELRLAECQGQAGQASVTLALPHVSAAMTDLTGGRSQSLAGGPKYEFGVRPQQIVTLRFKTGRTVEEIKPVLNWDHLVPPEKLPQLKRKLPGVKGHPPLGHEG